MKEFCPSLQKYEHLKQIETIYKKKDESIFKIINAVKEWSDEFIKKRVEECKNYREFLKEMENDYYKNALLKSDVENFFPDRELFIAKANSIIEVETRNKDDLYNKNDLKRYDEFLINLNLFLNTFAKPEATKEYMQKVDVESSKKLLENVDTKQLVNCIYSLGSSFFIKIENSNPSSIPHKLE